MEKKRLLVVEDDAIQIQVLATRLKTDGYEVAIARDAVQSISLARKEKPDLVLLDIGLPGGDGYIVLQRLKALPHALPVVAMSARPAETERDKMLQSGADDYFEKPVKYERLLERIKELIGATATP